MPRDQLLQLIRTLNKQEKKIVTVANKNNKTKSYELYKKYVDLLSKNLPDEKIELELKKFLRRKPAIHKDIANVRNQLKEKLLHSLVSAQQLDDAKSKIQFNINAIRLLIKRKLFDEAEHSISQTTKSARLKDDNRALLEITDLYLFLISQRSNKNDEILNFKLIEDIKNYHALSGLALTLRNIFRQLYSISKSDLQLKKTKSKIAFRRAYQQFDFNNFSISKYKQDKHTIIIFYYYRAKILYNQFNGSIEEAYKDNRSLIEYFEQEENLISNFQSYYIKSICSFTRICQYLGNYEEMEKSLKKVEIMYKRFKDYTALEATCDIGVLYYLNTQQYQKAAEMADFIKNEWTAIFSNTIDGKLLWYCHSNLVLFWIEDNKTKFKHWLEKGLNIPRPQKNQAFYFGIRIFELIDDFEQKKSFNFDHKYTFLHKVEALQKSLSNNENLGKFEKIVLPYFRKLFNVYNSNKNFELDKSEIVELKNKTFQSLKTTLQQLKFNTPPINYDEILLWCESHLQNKTIKEVFEAEVQMA